MAKLARFEILPIGNESARMAIKDSDGAEWSVELDYSKLVDLARRSAHDPKPKFGLITHSFKSHRRCCPITVVSQLESRHCPGCHIPTGPRWKVPSG